MQKNRLVASIIMLFLFTSFSFAVDVPAPNSFYDFEEGTGTDIKDSGPAENHGEMVGDNVDWADEGIYSSEGESKGCFELLELNAFGDQSYIEIPFADFHNSTNYTFSAWVQWNLEADPDWAYVFWQNGPTYDENENEDFHRHVDMWWNPGNLSLSSVVHDQTGVTAQLATTSEETGINTFDGDWHHVAITLADESLLTMYIDGAWGGELDIPEGVAQNDGDALWLGCRPADIDGLAAVKMIGKMDRVRIWDVTLSEAQIETVFLSEGPDGGVSAVENKQPETVNSFALAQNYPNPFNPSTTIEYSLDSQETISIDVYNLIGSKIRTLVSGVQSSGQHSVQWDGQNDIGQDVAGGVYMYRLTTGNRVETRKMILMR